MEEIAREALPGFRLKSVRCLPGRSLLREIWIRLEGSSKRGTCKLDVRLFVEDLERLTFNDSLFRAHVVDAIRAVHRGESAS